MELNTNFANLHFQMFAMKKRILELDKKHTPKYLAKCGAKQYQKDYDIIMNLRFKHLELYKKQYIDFVLGY